MSYQHNKIDLERILEEFRNGDKTYMDSETVGLNSIMVLLQWAVDDGPIYLYSVWNEPVWKTLQIIEAMLETTVVMFNSSFDWFHLAKIYTIWSLLPKDWIPAEHIEEIAVKYERAGQDGPCIKPKHTLDLLLHSRRGEFQTLMRRSDIRIRRVPTPLAYALAKELEDRVEIPGIYFAKAKDPSAPRWVVLDVKTPDGEINPDFKDVVLKFKAAGGLKFLAEHVLKTKPNFHYGDIEIDNKFHPPDKKLGYIPTALGMAPGGPEDDWKIYDKHGKLRGHAWPHWVQHHIDHWETNNAAREYAYYDIVYTRALDEYFDYPAVDDDDSVLACMVGAVRWHGFTIDTEGMRELCKTARERVLAAPVNINKPWEIRAYIQEAMDDTENLLTDIGATTKKAVLIKISKQVISPEEHGELCTKCEGEGCIRCFGEGKMDAERPIVFDDTGGIEVGNHAAAVRAAEILDAKSAAKEIELYDKLIRAGKFHPDFDVIGTLSTRMSGGESGLNSQGIKSTKEVRKLFPLKWGDQVLSGGDFDSFEVVLAATVYQDPDLYRALTEKLTCEGCKHGETCLVCKGAKEVDGFKCKACIQEGPKDNKKPTGKYNCPICEGKGWYRKKIHALFGQAMHPGKSYEDIVASAGTSFDMYTRGKSGVFGMIYGGNWATLVKNFGLKDEVAQAAEERFFRMFPGIKKARQRIIDMFESMVQIEGGQIFWREPAEYIESFLGFRRRFTLENTICKALYDLASKPPKEWHGEYRKIRVRRSQLKGEQTATGATMSALFGAAFGIQATNTRAAANHEIQSPGGQITKKVQRDIWDLQPHGVHEFLVAPMNIHDEIMCVNARHMTDQVAETVKTSVESYRDLIPLIGMTWNKEQATWAEKSDGSVTLKIQPPELAA